MTDLEMTRLCAEAMGIFLRVDRGSVIASESGREEDEFMYEPLNYDAYVMEMVKRFQMVIERDPKRSDYFGVTLFAKRPGTSATDTFVVRHTFDLNRAIVECVAKMQAAKASK